MPIGDEFEGDRGLNTNHGVEPEYVAFDLETTGLLPESDRIVEIGAVRFRPSGEVVAEFDRLVNPLRPSSPRARAVHGISDQELTMAETAEVVLPEFVSFLGDPHSTTLMAHNASFDAGFLGRELARLGQSMPGHSVIDTLTMARRRWPRMVGGHKLDGLATKLGLDPHGSHRALADSRRVRGLWLALNQSSDEIESDPLAFPIFDACRPPPAPRGWSWVEDAIGRNQTIRIEYAGGTRGLAPRSITPRKFAVRGGVAYLVALCHLDRKEKEFRLDRVRGFAIVAEPTPG